MHSFAALQRAAALAVILATFGGSALAQTSTPTPDKTAHKKPIAAHVAKPTGKPASKPIGKPATKVAHAADINVTRVAGAPRARRKADVIVLQGSGAQDGVKALVSLYAQRHGVPETLAHRIVVRESRYNPAAYNRAQFGLMQISLPTARSMGYTGAAQGLLDARTNLTYGMPYLANAWIISGGSEAQAQALYSRGYYNDAKRKGLIRNLRNASSAPVQAVDAETVAAAQ